MKRFSTTLFLFFISVAIIAQQPPCGNSPAAGNACQDAVSICDLNGYCGSTSASYTEDAWGSTGFLGIGASGLIGEFCSNIQNNSFLTFTAESSTVNLDIWVGNCTTGEGIQVMVFQADGNCSGDVDSYYCNDQFFPTGAGTESIVVSGLTAGEDYYVMMDGFSGDVCDYTFIAGAGSGVSIPVQVIPENATICQGESIDLTAEGGDGTYSWDASPDLNATTGSTVTVTPPATPGTYTYTVNSNSVSSCSNATSATASITVEGCLGVNNTGPVCAGGTFDLSANTGVGTVTSMSWSGPNGFSSTDQNPSGVVAPNSPGSYDYTFTATIDGVVNSAVTTVEVEFCPNGCDLVDITNAFTDAGCIELDACSSDCSMYFLNPQSMTGDEAQVFAESLGANLVSVQSQAENDCILNALNAIGESGTIWIGLNDATTEGTFVWYDQSPVVYTNWASGEPNQNGNEDCVQIYPTGSEPGMWNDLDCNDGNTKSIIEVNLCPVVDAGPDITICDGETATIQSNPTILGSAPYTYQWSNGGPADYPNSVTPSTTTDYVLSSEDQYGCIGSDTMTVEVTPLPSQPSVSVNGPVCPGENGVFTISGGANQVITYSLDGGLTTQTVTLDGNGQANVTVSGMQSDTNILITDVASGTCTDTYNVSTTILVDLSGNIPTIINPIDPFCSGDPAGSFSATPIGGTWSGPGIVDPNSGVFDPSVAGVGNHVITYTPPGACSDPATIVVPVNPSPDAVITGGGDTVLVDTPVDLTADTVFIYSWEPSEYVSCEDCQTTTVLPPETTTFVLTVENEFGCQDTASVTVFIEYPCEGAFLPNIFSPNNDQTNDEFCVLTSPQCVIEMNLKIYNRWGELIFSSGRYEDCWDGTYKGKPVNNGSYVYTFQATLRDGTKINKNGNISLVR